MPQHTHWNGIKKEKKKEKDVEQQHSYTADEYINWFNQWGKLFSIRYGNKLLIHINSAPWTIPNRNVCTCASKDVHKPILRYVLCIKIRLVITFWWEGGSIRGFEDSSSVLFLDIGGGYMGVYFVIIYWIIYLVLWTFLYMHYISQFEKYIFLKPSLWRERERGKMSTIAATRWRVYGYPTILSIFL